ncbi:D-alanine--poly(phosphoribitol) ligase subunit DltA [Limosilactobacillus reuteri]|uniref:D-alanine--poly(phosphoribitol) ligase subunit DltA n=1 Tax=Limosilactobacillus reuteri TaxID=1598 RepID=UPI000BEEC9F6|nr:D-alanine--poly(phosphoribitol) ligase subunit DltA [Limosilactobacillus reuteri]PEG94774.1 D-alanine--poly(phosphoribitol) ligase subunit 1 [Lactobacillus sp. UMNPBX10]MCC4485279.1 D-alanine--poly(phosphoribitol) ligase subunit DltA [Limosilactobacillus reuteri]MCC4516077.1 D-alanine--poly(phosphoribitol) ligase subunit DltA [Limosilactobacillus reuteri]MDD1400313.1 D-alanine--poly(phosphoribitol) ligase subunit DltA [Limosilactobacillus reuteri]MDD1407479.1 D-alanine--poly(phosphoribitol)
MSKNIITVFEQIAKDNSTRIAYDEMGKTTTYADLSSAIDTLAAWLSTQSLPDRSPILVYGDHQVEMIISFLAALKAGHTYIPVSNDSAIPRMQSILDTAKPAMIIAVNDFPSNDLQFDAPIVDHQQLEKILATPQTFDTSAMINGDELAYVLFTSGTTGSPKGVEVSHDNFMTFVDWMLSDEFKIKEHANFLGQPPYSFDLSNMYWLPALLNGGTIKALPHEVVENFGQMFTALPNLDLEVFVGTPSFADMLMLSPAFNQQKMPSLKTFLFCGEELTVKTAKGLHQRFPDAKIFNTYGPTETTVAVSGIEITPEIIENNDRLPVGYAKPGVKLSIWNGDQEITTPGEQGEIVISGNSVARGYMNNPEKTAKSFFKIDGVPAYRTGDAGTLDSDGLLHHKGRMDFQIKLHGYRIELDEVRASLEKSPLIKQAVAVPKYNKDGKVTHLIAYVIPNESTEDTAGLTKQIRESLDGLIMPYMMPTQFVYRESFPMSANGKIAVKQMIAEANK